MSLSDEQEYAFNKFTQGHNLVITGPGVTGKSKLIQHLVQYANERRHIVQVTALTGCASILLGLNSKTIHSWSGMRLCKGSNEEIIEKAVYNQRTKRNWKGIKILIIDEASMMSAKMLFVLDSIGRQIRKIDRPFGGIQVVLTCDFYQLPPIATSGDEDSGKFCFECHNYYELFPLANHVVLTKIFRQNDVTYINILNEIRKGEISESNAEILRQYVNRVYDKEKYGGAALTKLFPTKSRVDAINESMFGQIDDETHIYLVDTCVSSLVDYNTKKPLDATKMEKCRKMTTQDKEN